MVANNPRILHTMLRVGNLERSLDFYINLLGMKLLRKEDFPGGRFTLAFVGYAAESESAAVELTYNWDNENGYDIGTGYGHIALGIHGIATFCHQLAENDVVIIRQPGPMAHGTVHIAFIQDPDGYKVELIDLDTVALS